MALHRVNETKLAAIVIHSCSQRHANW